MNNRRLLVKFQSWAREQPRYQWFVHGSEKDKKASEKHCEYINDCATCVEKWEKIASNLNDPRITNIDARTLNMYQLARSSTKTWCFYHNTRCGTSTAQEPGEEGTYNRNGVNEVHDLILNHGVLDTIEYDPVIAASFMKSVTLKIMQTCREHGG